MYFIYFVSSNSAFNMAFGRMSTLKSNKICDKFTWKTKQCRNQIDTID